MGWLFTPNTNKRQMIAECVGKWNTKDRRIQHNNKLNRTSTYATYFNSECIRHCYRGNAFMGVLWKVVECKMYDIRTDEFIRSERWIGCDLLRWDKSCQGWGYKNLEESSHPCYYSCPLGYLNIVFKVTNKEWREKVRKYHEIRNRKYKIDDILKFEGCKIPWAIVVSLRPLVAEYSGVHYKISKGLIDRVITPQELEQEMEVGKKTDAIIPCTE